MTEAEWLACEESTPMLESLRDRASNRKLRLFVVAVCARGWSLFLDERSCNAVFVAGQFADGSASEEELRAARASALAARDDVARLAPRTEFNWWGNYAAETAFVCAAMEAFPPRDRPAAQHDYFVTAAGFAADAIALVRVQELEEAARLHELPDDGTFDDARCELWEDADAAVAVVRGDEWLAQANLLRDVFGNPFRPVTFAPAWRTDTAIALAAEMYESRDFSAMPILADALQDAGCDNDDILNHCRDPKSTHVRGCWVVDLVLGKE